jgi:hypothetical protein
LQLVIQNFTPTTQCAIYSRYNSDSGSNYLNVNYTLSGTSQTYGETLNTLSSDQHTSGTNLIVVDIFNYANTTTRKLLNSFAITQNNGTPNFNCIATRGSWNSTAAISSITLLPGAGTATGTALLYGVK